MSYGIVGSSVLRKEVIGKVTGQADYVDDLCVPDMWHGITVRSTIPRGRILGVTYQDGVPWNEITVVTAVDIPGKNIVSLIVDDQPYLASTHVNHMHEPILLLAHPNKNLLEKARSLVKINYEPLPAVFNMDTSLSLNQVIWGEDNVFKRYLMEKGDVDSAWSSAAHIVEGEYRPARRNNSTSKPMACWRPPVRKRA